MAECQNANLFIPRQSAQDRGPNNPCLNEVKGRDAKKIHSWHAGSAVIPSVL